MYDPIYTTLTNAQGLFKLVLPEGEYKLTASCEGYLPSLNYEDVDNLERNYASRMTMIRTPESNAPAIAGVNVGDALTGEGVQSARVRFRRGYNNKSGALVRTADGGALTERTDVNGRFQAKLPYGVYTAEVTMPGYTTAYINFFVGESVSEQAVMTRAMTEILPAGETRITLEWGYMPPDLDAHLTGSVSGTYERFHIFFPVKGTLIENAMLDRDDRRGNGFETTTIYKQNDGVYIYSVFDYSNGLDYSSAAMSASGARVSVYRGDRRVAVFDIPANRRGNLWEVFRLEGDVITPVNNVTAHQDLSFYSYYQY
jgi:hypothetical protein